MAVCAEDFPAALKRRAKVVDGQDWDSHAGRCRLHSQRLLRWAISRLTGTVARRYPETDVWKEIVMLFRKFSQQFGTKELLMDLALGRVEAMPFPSQEVAKLKDGIVVTLHEKGFTLQRLVGDRDELPIDFRLLHLLLRASADPEVHLGQLRTWCEGRPGNSDAQVASAVQA